MFYAIEKFQRRAQEMASRRYVDMVSISPMTAMEDSLGPDDVHTEAPANVEGYEYREGDTFVGRDRYLWIEKKVKMPEKREGYEVVGLFDFGKTDGGYGRGFESLLYVDGIRYQGVDTYHNDVVFEQMAGHDVRLTFLLWTGLEGGGPHRISTHVYRQAQLGYLHKAASRPSSKTLVINFRASIMVDSSASPPRAISIPEVSPYLSFSTFALRSVPPSSLIRI